MNESIRIMLARYHCKSLDDYRNALKEIIQEIALLGLWRHHFFTKALFYGGTALRILYGLDRFSEDLDFSLIDVGKNFSLSKYTHAVQEELESYGFRVKVEKKTKTKVSAIQSAFIKANTLENMLFVEMPENLGKTLHLTELIKIRLEIDTNPPGSWETEEKYILLPTPFTVKTYTPPNLFAGKMHSALCREWKSRIKGRDWYDLIWFLSKKTPLSLDHLSARMQQTGHFSKKKKLTKELFFEIYEAKVNQLDIAKAKEDILPFIKNPEVINIWSKDFFRQIIQQIHFV